MNQPSAPVQSSQHDVYSRLGEIVRRHLDNPWEQPFHIPTQEAFERLSGLEDFVHPGNLILDSGCGTGESTRRLAHAFPESIVVGIDQSASRLSRLGHLEFPHSEGNAFWIQGELGTFWRLARRAGWRLERHYLLYPNPWPKARQVRRRWHAHPAFPELLALGGKLEMRCNWKIYAEEFAVAIRTALGHGVEIRLESAARDQDWPPVETPFGRKYARSGHRLYRVRVDLREASNRLFDNPVE